MSRFTSRATFHKIKIFIYICICLLLTFTHLSAFAATSIPFTVNMSEAVNVTGTPRIAVDVGGVTRYATYTSGTGSSALTFTYAMVAGDVDLDGVTLTSPIDLNGGAMKDLSGNDLSPLTYTLPNTSNVKVNYPSLGMDFIYDADGRYTLNGTVYNDLTSFLSAAGGTFTRASTATYYDSAGTLQTAASGAPRFDYDPTTHVAKGILIEESRTNLLLQSNSFTTSPWDTTTCGGVSNSGSTTVAPNGSSTPIYNFSTSACLYQDASITNGSIYTHSIWIKANQTATIGFRTPGSNIASPVSINISVGTTWQRYTVTATATQTFSRFLIDNRSAQGYGVSGLQLSFFGGQMELGAFPTSYIPTTSSAITRSSDALSIPTGTWYSSSQGTFFSNSALSYNGNTTFPSSSAWTISDGTNSNKIRFFQNGNGGNPNVNMFNSGASQANYALSSVQSASTDYKFGFTYTTNDAIAYGQGASLGAQDTTVTIPTMNTLNIGRGALAGEGLFGWLKTFKYYPARTPNTQLQLMTQ